MTSLSNLGPWADRYVNTTPGKAVKTMRDRLADDKEDNRAMGAAIFAALARAVRCRACGRRLKDPTSVELGIGPECLQRAEAEATAANACLAAGPRGEFEVEVGECRLVSAKPKGRLFDRATSPILLVLLKRADGTLVNAWADASRPPLAAVFVDGVTATLIRYKLAVFRFTLERHRSLKVARTVPFRRIPTKYVDTYLTNLEVAA